LSFVNAKPYTLTFARESAAGSAGFPRYARRHVSLRSAQAAARQVMAAMETRGLSARAHPAIIYGPRGQVFTA
jgi:hypothetical protein